MEAMARIVMMSDEDVMRMRMRWSRLPPGTRKIQPGVARADFYNLYKPADMDTTECLFAAKMGKQLMKSTPR